ncbi:MAG: enoyl-CoA hydratase [Rhodospirillales bacterium]|jgi:enoyl-CoA hydratase/carnithine racemase|uniref:enoyl-CoA hydratase/isomerase family protein n=1 Tax=Hwanghaeella sp. 1Z406 TaxID=3402811 RepID=UPI000C96D579|nr:enoyl-CoA hydratase [Rhodospirillales bacterium]|tara:strand:+ start:79722 stop:80498 length:777 start_codon:yes stop_codon:yes gene_type:complete
MTSSAVSIVNHKGVRVITMDQPDTRNALTPDLRDALLGSMEDAVADADCRAIVLTGSGKSFCAGGDLNSLPESDPAAIRLRLSTSHRLVRLVAAGPKPVVAAVQGYAFGAGLSLACACDLVFATPNASFGAVFGKVGLTGDMGLLWSLPQRIGIAETKRLMFRSGTLTAAQALQLGLVDEVAQEGDVVDAAVAAAGAFLETAPLSIAAAKDILARGPAPLDDVLKAEIDHQILLFSSRDFSEGRRAFQERRQPGFVGR